MRNRFNLEFYAEADARSVPNAPGLYAFYVRPLTPPSLGLLNSSALTSEVAARVKRRMEAIARRFLTFAHTATATGQVVQAARASHLALRLDVSVERRPEVDRVAGLVHVIPEQELRDVLTLLGQVALFAQPVYVGITLNQTLADRYEQHRQDYMLEPSDSGTFGGRLRLNGFDWESIAFGCMPVEESELSGASLDFLERYFQALACPVLSIR